MKRVGVLFAVAIVMALISGCGSAPAPQGAAQGGGPAVVPLAPAWVGELPHDEYFWGVGFMRLQNPSLAMQTATEFARQDAAQQISAVVQASLQAFAAEEGIIDDTRSLIAIENIGRGLIDMDLRNASVMLREQTADGTWWVRVSVSKDEATRQTSSIVNNETADFAEFRADQAIRRLEADLQRAQIRSEGHTE